MLLVETPVDPKFKKGYGISQCYCCLSLPGPENRGFVWLRRMACLVETCKECCEGEFLDCKDPTGKCGDWIKCRLLHARPSRERKAAEGSNSDRGSKLTVRSLIQCEIVCSF